MNITSEHIKILLIAILIVSSIVRYLIQEKGKNRYSTGTAVVSISCLLMYLNTVTDTVRVPFQWPIIFILLFLWIILDIKYRKSVKVNK